MTMFTQYFYHQQIKKFILAFGNLFSDITIQKHEKNGTIHQEIVVPIAYAPKNKWVARVNEQNDFMVPQVEITLPRITFEMVDMKYAPEKKIGFSGAYVLGTSGSTRTKIYNPSPWDVTFNLYSYAKDQTDSLQILEQILPYFQPFLTVNYEVLPAYQIMKDVHISLVDSKVEDLYEGSPDNVRQVIQTFTFNATLDFFGPLAASSSVIKDVLVDFAWQFPNKAHTRYEAKVDPLSANVDEVYIIIETINNTI